MDVGNNPDLQQGELAGGLAAEPGRSAGVHGQVQAGSMAQRSSRTHRASELLVGCGSWHVSLGTYFAGLQSLVVGSGV